MTSFAVLDDCQDVARAYGAQPHPGYVTGGNYTRCFADAVEDVAAFLRGAPVRVLTRPAGGGRA